MEMAARSARGSAGGVRAAGVPVGRRVHPRGGRVPALGEQPLHREAVSSRGSAAARSATAGRTWPVGAPARAVLNVASTNASSRPSWKAENDTISGRIDAGAPGRPRAAWPRSWPRLRPPALSFAIAAPGAGDAWPRRRRRRARACPSSPSRASAGAAVRATVVRVVRRKGLRVTTGIPRAEGTGQYYTWAREVGVKAFVAGELETRGQRQRATFLVWSGNSGSIVGRWTVVGRTGQLPVRWPAGSGATWGGPWRGRSPRHRLARAGAGTHLADQRRLCFRRGRRRIPARPRGPPPAAVVAPVAPYTSRRVVPNAMAAHGRYAMLRKVADGGMAEIFLAQQTGEEGFSRHGDREAHPAGLSRPIRTSATCWWTRRTSR